MGETVRRSRRGERALPRRVGVTPTEFEADQVDRRSIRLLLTQTTILASAPIFDIITIAPVSVSLHAPPPSSHQ